MRTKVYGMSKMNTCPFCNRMATQKNERGVEVCYQHIKAALEEIRCTCGSWLEQREGKFGTYFNCINCGNINFKKALEMKALMKPKENISVEQPKVTEKIKIMEPPRERKEITISSNDTEYFD